MHVTRVAMFAALVAFLSPATDAVSRYVSSVGGSDNVNNCRFPETPCKTITHAMSQASSSTTGPTDTIEVAPGFYNNASGEVFPINVKAGVTIIAPGYEHLAAVDATGANARAFVIDVAPGNASLQNLVIRGGRHAPSTGNAGGGAIGVVSGTAEIVSNHLEDNHAVGNAGAFAAGGNAYGGAVWGCNDCMLFVYVNIFVGNSATGGNGSVFGAAAGGNAGGGAVAAPRVSMVNNTFYGNHAIGGNAGGPSGVAGNATGGAAMVLGGLGSVYNNIFASNTVGAGSGQPSSSISYSALESYVQTGFNLFWLNLRDNILADNANTLGEYPLIEPPGFHHEPDNLRIGLTSPAYRTGYIGVSFRDFEGGYFDEPPARGAYEARGYDFLATDLDGSGRSDILWRNVATGQVYRFLMNGFAITSGAMVYHEPNTDWKIVGDADFNADGTTDLLWRNSATGQVWVMWFTGAGYPYGGQTTYREVDPAWKIVATPDLDGNGHADVLWWNSSTGAVYATLLQGGSYLGGGYIYQEPNTAWRIVGVGDLLGTGKQNELVWRNSSTGQVFLMHVTYNGSAFYQSGRTFHVEPNLAWKIVAVSDFTGDTRADILWRNESTGQVFLQQILDLYQVEPVMLYTEPDLAWKIVATGDYDGDGITDILWRNDATGYVFLMRVTEASPHTAGNVVYIEANPDWRIMGPAEFAAAQ